MKFRGNLQELAIAWLPNLQKRARIETAGNGATAIQLFFECLANQVLLQTLAASVFEDARKPEELLAI
jgi:hypothetical protein